MGSFAIPLVLSYTLVICKFNTVKSFRPLGGVRRNEARDDTPCIPHP